MPRPKSPHLTEAELKLMHVLWKKGNATVSEVVEAVAKNAGGVAPAYSTVLTTMRILENKGYVRHTKEGRAFVYKPVVPRDRATEKAVSHLLRRFFENSAELLMLNLLERKNVDAETIKRLRKRIEEKKT
jgi:BlaI family transcriptional regulator, penicillinase repressor